jgi:pilus assembly protein CpaE
VATHLALDVVRSVPGHRVCLIDLDLEKGDVTGLLMARHRASVADVAKVADDLSSRAVADAVVAHESGLHLLLAPLDLHDVEAVTPRALREVVAVLRQDYDLVIIDAGSHVTPAQAAVVELGDEVVAVTTPDVVAVRGLRRSITMWEQLAVREEGDIRVLVNRIARATSVSADMVRQLTKAPVIGAGLPAMFRRLEPALNQRDPFLVREPVWWRSLRFIGQEVGVAQGQPTVPAEVASPSSPRDGQSRGRTRRHDAGSASLELVGIFPTLLVAALLAWQMALYGMSFVWSGHAASVAARAQSVGADPQAAARAGLPESVAGRATVSTPSPNRVTVRVRVPLVAPRLGSLPVTVTSSREVVREP